MDTHVKDSIDSLKESKYFVKSSAEEEISQALVLSPEYSSDRGGVSKQYLFPLG